MKRVAVVSFIRLRQYIIFCTTSLRILSIVVVIVTTVICFTYAIHSIASLRQHIHLITHVTVITIALGISGSKGVIGRCIKGSF